MGSPNVPTEGVTSELPDVNERKNTGLSSLETEVGVIEVQGGTPDQSEFVDGLMIKKNLAHKVIVKTGNEW